MFVGRQEDCNWVLRTKDKPELRCRQEANIAPRLGNNWEARKRAGCTTRYNLPVACRSLSPKIQRYFFKKSSTFTNPCQLTWEAGGKLGS